MLQMLNKAIVPNFIEGFRYIQEDTAYLAEIDMIEGIMDRVH